MGAGDTMCDLATAMGSQPLQKTWGEAWEAWGAQALHRTSMKRPLIIHARRVRPNDMPKAGCHFGQHQIASQPLGGTTDRP